MALRILNVEYTEDFKNKTSKSYKKFEKNFTEAVSIVYGLCTLPTASHYCMKLGNCMTSGCPQQRLIFLKN